MISLGLQKIHRRQWTNYGCWKPEARSPIFALGIRHRSYGERPHAIPFPMNGEPSDRVYSGVCQRKPERSHPVNAILNYAYAVLQSQVQIRLVSEGYDPMRGIMHYDQDYAPAFVFDMMEPERPKVDRAVLAFLKSEALHPADFTIREDGVVRLNPELARRVSGLAARGALAQAAFVAASKQAQPGRRWKTRRGGLPPVAFLVGTLHAPTAGRVLAAAPGSGNANPGNGGGDGARINWMFSTDKARTKMARAYPVSSLKES